MKQFFEKTMREQIQADLDNPKELIKKAQPKSGWIRLIRQALGMTTYQLAKRIGCSQGSVMSFERREKSGNITLNSLDRAAKALNCRCVYIFVPQKPLSQLMEDQARVVAKKRLRVVSHSMDLEHQKLDFKQLKQQEEALVNELLQGPVKYLWED